MLNDSEIKQMIIEIKKQENEKTMNRKKDYESLSKEELIESNNALKGGINRL